MTRCCVATLLTMLCACTFDPTGSAPVAPGADATALDAGDSETSWDATQPPLPFGAPCLSESECATGLCAEVGGDLVCTQSCESAVDCPGGIRCSHNVCDTRRLP